MENKVFDFLYGQQLVSASCIIYELADEMNYFVKTKHRAETLHTVKNSDGKIVWQNANGFSDNWIQAAGEGIERNLI